MSLPRNFSVMVKPVGSQCNLRCAYCYYLDKSLFYPSDDGKFKQTLMSDRVLREYIEQYFDANDSEVVTFCWHGGEPLMAGMDFYKRALKYQKKYGKGRKVENALQTNGLLMNQEWCRFFHDNLFLIGLSLDGPAEIHDNYRRTLGGGPTFTRVMRAVENMAKHRVEFNTMTVVNRLSEGRGAELYKFFKAIGSHYMQFIPAVDLLSDEQVAHLGDRQRLLGAHQAIAMPENSHLSEWSISAEGYGRFMCEVYDEWIKKDVGRYYVQLFDATLANYYGAMPGLCSSAETCGNALVVEHNGDVYSCDHFVFPEYLLGNLKSRHISEMQSSPELFHFGIAKAANLPSNCRSCSHYKACKGGCPKHRFVPIEGEKTPHNYLCAGYQLFFEHVRPSMERMCSLLHRGESPMKIMEERGTL